MSDDELLDDEALKAAYAGEGIPDKEEDAPAEEEAEEASQAPAEAVEDESEEPEEQRPGEPDRRVPLKALQEERKKRQELESRIERLLTLAQQRAEQPPAKKEEAPPPPEEPDMYERPFDYMQNLRGKYEQLNQTLTERQEAEQQRQAQQAFETRLAAHEQEYMREAPDYADRVAKVKQSLYQTYLVQGYDQPSAAEMARRNMLSTAYNVAQSGQSPAEYFYKAAEQFGYQPKPPANSNEPRQDGRKVHKSMSDAAGAAGKSKLDMSRLAKMSDLEFDAELSRLGLDSKDIMRELSRR